MYFVYVLESQKDGSIHIGSTGNVEKRLELHNEGRVQATKNKRPLVLLYQEPYNDKQEAFSRERFYRTPRGKSVLKKKIESK